MDHDTVDAYFAVAFGCFCVLVAACIQCGNYLHDADEDFYQCVDCGVHVLRQDPRAQRPRCINCWMVHTRDRAW